MSRSYLDSDRIYVPLDNDGSLSGAINADEGLRVNAERNSSATDTVATSDSGRVFVATASSGTQTFTLPSAASAGLTYTFVCGDAGGEILIDPASGQSIVGKTSGAEDATGIAPAAGTGIKNTAATNVVGDHCTLVSDGTTTWYMTSVAGVWASQ